jgi:hypothetical protein
MPGLPFYPVRVLRRKRRQPEVATAAAISDLTWFLDNLTVDPGISTSVTLIFRGAGLSGRAPLVSEMFLKAYDVGTGAWVVSMPTSIVATPSADGMAVDAVFTFEADLAEPVMICVPAQWAAVRSPLGTHPVGGELSIVGAGSWISVWQ